MGGYQKQRPAFLQLLQNGHRNPHAFRRVRAGAKLIHHHQALRGHPPENIQYIHDMGREGGQILRQILAVPDVAENIPVHTDLRLLTGNVKPALGHQAAQRHGLQCHGLAPRIGSGYHNSVYAVSQGKLQRHTDLRVHQGMSGIPQKNAPFADDFRFPAVVAFRKLPLGKNKIQLLHHPDVLYHGFPVLRNQRA